MFKRFIILFLFLFSVWYLLAGSNDQEMIAGAVICLILAAIFTGKTPILSELNLTPRALGYFVAYVFVFFLELIKANLDVAVRVISPSLPINPGIVKVKTRLKSKFSRIMLANSITLTPGTLTVEIDGEYLYIHWINVTSENIEDATEKIVKKFERYLEVIFV